MPAGRYPGENGLRPVTAPVGLRSLFGTDSRVVCQLLQGGAIGAGPRGQCLVFRGGPLLLCLLQTANLFNLSVDLIFCDTNTASFAVDSRPTRPLHRAGWMPRPYPCGCREKARFVGAWSDPLSFPSGCCLCLVEAATSWYTSLPLVVADQVARGRTAVPLPPRMPCPTAVSQCLRRVPP